MASTIPAGQQRPLIANLRVNERERELLKRAAAAKGVSVSQFMRSALQAAGVPLEEPAPKTQ